MKIPNNNLSFVAENKIADYLLSDNHEIGKHKADFFKRFGFDLSNVETFKGSLIQHAVNREIFETIETAFGTKYKLRCEIITPDERNPCIISVWIIENAKTTPILITAFPDK